MERHAEATLARIMRRMAGKLGRVLVALGVLASTLAASPEEIDEAVAHHDEHPGLLHPEEGAGHEHGDGDDHHESPESPCHHHGLHVCCAHVPALFAELTCSLPDLQLVQAFHAPAPAVHLSPSETLFFHVPLA